MPSKKIKTLLEPGKVYHIYNRGNNHQIVFFRTSNYDLFLEKIGKYLLNYCSILTYVLIPNHYHILLKINDDLEVNKFSQQFLKFSLSYTNKINWEENRNGSLFISHFRRIHVDTEDYLKRLVYYIHNNPEKHELTEDFRLYKYSSYQAILSNKTTNMAREYVLDLFGGKTEFKEYHEYMHEESQIKKFILEDS